MASRLLVTGQGNALLTASQDQGWPRHDSRHAKTRGGQGKAQGKAITRAWLPSCWVTAKKLLDNGNQVVGLSGNTGYRLKSCWVTASKLLGNG
ncbi:hypothetical protein RHSIM_Rhsim02G0139700 [Rhododendron simsii]|uniref:Uncharacterized protein n=1 Tax=Rhododendron simsii TaxID=118357 RepID=A0A834LWI3_RHOSS|nr:hypothetical protein RHSIM_Rhsim02G0139700 [Rhododendron simsii]